MAENEPRFTAEVRDYLRLCESIPGLDRKYHPTADGAVKLIWHRGKDEAELIISAFTNESGKPWTALPETAQFELSNTVR